MASFSGAAQGASAGAAFGPWGAGIGALAGGLFGGGSVASSPAGPSHSEGYLSTVASFDNSNWTVSTGAGNAIASNVKALPDVVQSILSSLDPNAALRGIGIGGGGAAIGQAVPWSYLAVALVAGALIWKTKSN